MPAPVAGAIAALAAKQLAKRAAKKAAKLVQKKKTADLAKALELGGMKTKDAAKTAKKVRKPNKQFNGPKAKRNKIYKKKIKNDDAA